MKNRFMRLMVLAAAASLLAGCGGGAASTESAVSSAASSEPEIEMPLAVSKDEAIEPAAAPDGTAAEDAEDSGEEIANPFVPCKTLAVAEKLAGFSMKVPAHIEGYEEDYIQAIAGFLIDVAYTDGNGSGLLIRKGSGEDDISGDYNEYEKTEELAVGDRTVTAKSDGDGVRCAVWTQEGYSYAILADRGLKEEVFAGIVSELS